MTSKRIVDITVWNQAEHRFDIDRTIINIIILLFDMGLIINGLPCYTIREEARGTFYAQGPAEKCLDQGYYYTDGLRLNVSTSIFYKQRILIGLQKKNIPVQHKAETADEVFKVLRSKFPSIVTESWQEKNRRPRKIDSRTRTAFPSKHRYARFETIQQCLTIGRPLDDANISTELFPTILAALKGKLASRSKLKAPRVKCPFRLFEPLSLGLRPS